MDLEPLDADRVHDGGKVVGGGPGLLLLRPVRGTLPPGDVEELPAIGQRGPTRVRYDRNSI
jgi:hypothetical protein